MHILSLPVEIFEQILHECILARNFAPRQGVIRGLRLKLVCKTFRKSVEPVLFRTKLLEDFRPYDNARHGWSHTMWFWRLRRYYGADSFWHRYMLFRCSQETNPAIGRYVEVRNTAVAFSERTGADFTQTLDELCRLAAGSGGNGIPKLPLAWGPYRKYPGIQMPANKDHGLLCAAAHLNHIPLARELLQQGFDPSAHNGTFDEPMLLAAFAGHADMLMLFQEHLPDDKPLSQYIMVERRTWPVKAALGSVIGAAQRGDMAMLRLALYPPSRADPTSMGMTGQLPGAVTRDHSPLSAVIYHARFETASIEVLEFLCGLCAEPLSAQEIQDLLAQHAEFGNLEMVRHLLDNLGAEIIPPLDMGKRIPGYAKSALAGAARNGHDDIVALLLERGADPDNTRLAGSGLHHAAAAGHLRLVRMMLDHGAKKLKFALESAVRLEYTAMVELLLETGLVEKAWLDGALEFAAKNGLVSMVELLWRWGQGSRAEKCH